MQIQTQPAPAPPPPPAPPNPQALRDQIREQVREQVEAARAMAQDAAGGATTLPPATEPMTGVAVQAPFADMIPPQAVDISLAFFVTVFAIIVGFPIARAIARRIDRKGDAQRVAPGVTAQLDQITQSLEAMAIEIERISEGQRFTTRLLAEQQEHRAQLTEPAPGNGR
jgi:hypothetical protein